jgi:hypothetical protein
MRAISISPSSRSSSRTGQASADSGRPATFQIVMTELDPVIHFLRARVVDARVKPAHDGDWKSSCRKRITWTPVAAGALPRSSVRCLPDGQDAGRFRVRSAPSEPRAATPIFLAVPSGLEPWQPTRHRARRLSAPQDLQLNAPDLSSIDVIRADSGRAGRTQNRHCEPKAKQSRAAAVPPPGLLRRCAPRNDAKFGPWLCAAFPIRPNSL